MTVTIPELTIELQTDPQTLGYQAFIDSGDHAGLADLMNTIGVSDETIEPEFVSDTLVQSAVVYSEYQALDADQRAVWDLLIALNDTQIPVKDQGIRDQILSIWVGGTQTRTNLGALQTRDASRTEVVFDENDVVTAAQIGEALE